jgi:hypothetical protein
MTSAEIFNQLPDPLSPGFGGVKKAQFLSIHVRLISGFDQDGSRPSVSKFDQLRFTVLLFATRFTSYLVSVTLGLRLRCRFTD